MPTPTPIPGATLRQLADRDERVFPSYPQVARYFPSAAMEDARKRLGRAIDRGDGPGLVIGAPGMGKSLLLQVLAAQYHERFDVVLLASTRLCTRRALLQAVLFELGLPYKPRDEGELRLSLLDHLLSNTPPHGGEGSGEGGLLLLVDEAQTVPMALLDELRVMTNLVGAGMPRVRLVLAGSSALEEAFAHPELESFSQRLAARCYLAPLGRDETTQFIRAQIKASGGEPEYIFATEAWDAVFEATDGVPRLVNQLCDRALWFAAADHEPRINREIIQRAWADLQQLPTPWDTPPTAPSASMVTQVVEFGGLSDDICTHDVCTDDVIVDVEDTDLDIEDDGAEEAVANLPQAEPDVERRDPFAEKFEEEEVVLDNFAAWDDMFRRETPRVENRRDPGFATWVQAAIDASPALATQHDSSPPLSALREFDPEETIAIEEEAAESNLSAASSAASIAEGQSEWPPLRLAVVSEPAPLKPIPLVAPATRSAARGTPAADAVRPTLEIKRNSGNKTELPILVVEDDSAPSPAQPPVRREEYRHLFSRLRSG